MSNLRELTKEAHRSAERTSFMNRMLKKQITPYQYYVYIKNQLFAYTNLEYFAEKAGIFEGDMARLIRGPNLLDDALLMEVEFNFSESPIFESSHKYVEHIKTIENDRDKLLAHVYVRHMGDLSGGQMIKKLVPGPTNLYEFDGDVEDLKNLVRSKLHDGLEAEAKVCFSMVQKFLEELEAYFEDMGPAG